MYDDTRGNTYWQFLCCLFLWHTHAKQRPLDSHNLHHLQCVSLYYLPVAKTDPHHYHPEMQTQSASGCTAHLLILPLRFIYSLCAIRDQRSHIRMPDEYSLAFWSAQRGSERCEWVGGCTIALHAVFTGENVPDNNCVLAHLFSTLKYFTVQLKLIKRVKWCCHKTRISDFDKLTFNIIYDTLIGKICIFNESYWVSFN